jgi:hypothetical protein
MRAPARRSARRRDRPGYWPATRLWENSRPPGSGRRPARRREGHGRALVSGGPLFRDEVVCAPSTAWRVAPHTVEETAALAAGFYEQVEARRAAMAARMAAENAALLALDGGVPGENWWRGDG